MTDTTSQLEPVAEVIQADAENYKILIIKPQPAGTKLYTAPTRSTTSRAVPLTDEQSENIADLCFPGVGWHQQVDMFARAIEAAHGITAIEAKLKEKNA